MEYAKNIEIGRQRKVLRKTFIWDLSRCVNGVVIYWPEVVRKYLGKTNRVHGTMSAM